MDFHPDSLDWLDDQARRERLREKIAAGKRQLWLFTVLPLGIVLAVTLTFSVLSLPTWFLRGFNFIFPWLVIGIMGWGLYRLDVWKMRMRRAQDELQGVMSDGERILRDRAARKVNLMSGAVAIGSLVALSFSQSYGPPWLSVVVMWLFVAPAILWSAYRMIHVD